MHPIRFFSSKPPFALSAMAALLMAPGLSRPAHAVECRTIASVQASAVSSNNNDAGGHLNQHIFGATPPKGSSQTGKTLFTSIGEYSNVWNNYQNPEKFRGDAIACSGTKARQKVTVYSVLKKDMIGGFNCTAANAKGECTSKTKSQHKKIQLDFKLVQGQWILLTAYPTN